MNARKLSKRIVFTAIAAIAIDGALLRATMGSGTHSTLIGSARFDPFKVERHEPGDWSVKIDAKHGLQVATQTITFDPGGRSGWHSHPGPVLIAVKEGTMTFYNAHCERRVLVAGEGFLDAGDDAHIAVNESPASATNVVTYLVPPFAPSLRIDQPAPLNCSI